jgi:hypothetical protein
VPRKPLTFDDVLEIGRALPETEVATTYGVAALKIRGSLVTCPAIHSSAEPSSIMVRIATAERDRLLDEKPDVYYLTPHYAPYPCVVVRLPKIGRAELRELLGSAWRFVMERAPARARKRRARR